MRVVSDSRAVFEVEGFLAGVIVLEGDSEAEILGKFGAVDSNEKFAGASPVCNGFRVSAVNYVAVEGAARQSGILHCEAEGVRAVMGFDADVIVVADAVPVVAQHWIEGRHGAVGEDQILQAVAASHKEFRVVGLLTNAVNVEFDQAGGKLHGEEAILPIFFLEAILEGSSDAGMAGIIEFQTLVHEIRVSAVGLKVYDRTFEIVTGVSIAVIGQNAALGIVLTGILIALEADVEIISRFKFDDRVVDGNGYPLLLLAVAGLVDLQYLVAVDGFDSRAVCSDRPFLGGR